MAQKLTKEELKDFLDMMQNHKGRATEMISVYVPSGYDVNAVQRQLESEVSTAKNIKSNSTRKNVVDSLEKIIRALKEYRFTPENGLCLFAGNISLVEGQSDIGLWEIEPPEQIRIRLYRCDKNFVLEPLEDMTTIDEIYGLIVMDRKEATIGQLVGKRIEQLQNLSSGIPSKVRAGGQSSQRFHRITEGLTRDFYKRIADEAKNCFYGNERIKGIMIGGPIPTKDEFVEGEFLPTELQKKIIAIRDQGDTSESGLSELVGLAQDAIADQEIIYERNILKNFFDNLGSKPQTTPYHYDEILRVLKFGAADVLIISKEFDKSKLRELKEIAEQMGTKIEMVSTETDEGKQFLSISGIGAIQRFRV